MGGIATKLIERNTTVPTKKSQVFSTADDNQTAVDIRVVQGEREFAKDNKLLGQFRLEGIPSAPRGVPQVEVSFDIDANGIVSVSAKDKATGKEQTITITSSSGLKQEEIDRMIQEAKTHEDEDKKTKKTIEKRNHLDGAIIEIEKTINENRDKLNEDDITATEGAIEKAKQALKNHSDNAVELQKATDELTQASYKIAETLYKQKETTQQNETTTNESAPQGTPSSDQEPIDAEINQ